MLLDCCVDVVSCLDVVSLLFGCCLFWFEVGVVSLVCLALFYGSVTISSTRCHLFPVAM
jgi:hypothetical protein